MEEKIKTLLCKYRDLEISKTHLLANLEKDLKKIKLDEPVEIRASNLIKLLNSFRNKILKENDLIDWVNIVWFSGLYEYFEYEMESISSVMNELEELDEPGSKILDEEIEYYIKILEKNIDISSEK